MRTPSGARAPAPPPLEVRVCTAKTCRRQGAPAILKLAVDLALPGVAVSGTGCLGGCGAGPNVALLGGAATTAAGLPGVVANHVSTPAALFAALASAGVAVVSPALATATAARLAGNDAARAADWRAAVAHYTRGITAALAGGEDAAHALHLLFSNRSGARLSSGDAAGAATDADAAVAAGPAGWATGLVRQVRARGGERLCFTENKNTITPPHHPLSLPPPPTPFFRSRPASP